MEYRYINQELVNKHKTKQDLIDGISDIEVPAQGEARVEFSIKVNKISKAIKNTALIGNDEKETNSDVKETYGYNVEKELTSIERKGQKLDKNAPVQEGDILGYTITIENNGSTDIEDLYIKDIMPDSLEAQSDIEFKNVIVPAGETIKKEVKAKVKNVSGKIVNTVIAEDKNDTQEPDKESQEETQTIGFTINKEAKVIKADKNKDHAGYEEIAEEGDIILYTITVTNTGSTKLNGVRVEDRKSRVKIDEKIDLEPNGIDGYKKTITRNYQVVATDFELDELGKMKQINNVATATYEDSNGKIEKKASVNVTVRDSYDYTVEYYYDGIKDESATETNSGKYLEEINDYTKKLKDGYELQKTENLPLTITGNSNTNVIKVYYTKRTDLSYTVNYIDKKTGKPIDTPKVQNGMTFGAIVTSANEVITINGYNYDSVDKETLTITTGENVINIYYVKIDVTLTKTALAGGVEAKPLYKFKEGDVVKFKLVVTNNSSTHTVRNYVVTDTLPSELSYYGTQPDGTNVSGNVLTWTIDKIEPNESKEIIITTKVNQDQWSGDKYLHDIKSVTTASGNEKAMTEFTYNEAKYNYKEWKWEYPNKEEYESNTLYYNCAFYVYDSKHGEIPYEDGSTHYDPKNYSAVGFGRVSDVEYDKTLSNVDDINKVIDGHNNVADNIVYAPKYNPGKGKVVLWYVAKKIDPAKNEKINKTKAYVKYHVDGIIVDLNDIYSVKNEIKGSDGKTASDIILVKDDGSSKITSLARMIPANRVIYFDNKEEVNNKPEVITENNVVENKVNDKVAIENDNSNKIENNTTINNDVNENDMTKNEVEEEKKEEIKNTILENNKTEEINNEEIDSKEETIDSKETLETEESASETTKIENETQNEILEKTTNEVVTQNLQEEAE